jgi:hypothetical protein
MKERIKPTPEEAKAIAALHKLAKTWPKSLWLFSASGSLYVMRKAEDGSHASLSNHGVDPAYILGKSVNIENDGGDW